MGGEFCLGQNALPSSTNITKTEPLPVCFEHSSSDERVRRLMQLGRSSNPICRVTTSHLKQLEVTHRVRHPEWGRSALACAKDIARTPDLKVPLSENKA